MDAIDLHVKPIDPDAPGSYKAFKEWAALSKAIRDAKESGNTEAIGLAVLEAAKLTEAYIVDKDGRPVDVATLDLSLKQMLELMNAVGGQPVVPLENGSSSRAGPKARAPRRNGHGT